MVDSSPAICCVWSLLSFFWRLNILSLARLLDVGVGGGKLSAVVIPFRLLLSSRIIVLVSTGFVVDVGVGGVFVLVDDEKALNMLNLRTFLRNLRPSVIVFVNGTLRFLTLCQNSWFSRLVPLFVSSSKMSISSSSALNWILLSSIARFCTDFETRCDWDLYRDTIF